MFKPFLCVCLGGALGSGLRYLISLGLPLLLGKGFPYATLTVNLLGSFLMGILMALALHSHWLSPEWRLTLTTGLMGGLTTYSTFNYETLELFQRGAWALAGLNILLTLGLCLLAGMAGWGCGQGWAGAWLPR